jgi:C4-dicarboxylate-specific signal transduction histidine kinase
LSLQREVFDLYALFDIVRRFSAVLDTSSLMDGILLTAISQLGVGAAAVVIEKPGENNRLAVSKWKGWTEVCAEDWELDLGSPFARALASVQQPILFDDLRGGLAGDWPQTRLLARIGCVLIAPMRRRERLRGVLYTSGRLNGQPFSETDREFLALLVEQLTVSIENAILYESERRYAEDLILVREQLAQYEKMATLGRLSAAIAHEINNPLGIIRNYLQLTRALIQGHPQAAQNLEQVTAEVDRIARIVRQLLDAFHPETTRPTAVDVGAVLSEIVEFLAPELSQCGVIVGHSSFEDLPFVVGGADPLRQVLLNLTLNARDAMPNGGGLQIRVTVDDQRVNISFIDEGSGIAPENLPQLFEPFFSTKPTGRGSGLGLSICRSILEGFGGSIDAANVAPPRTGAVFRVSLRRVASPGDRNDRDKGTVEGGASA